MKDKTALAIGCLDEKDLAKIASACDALRFAFDPRDADAAREIERALGEKCAAREADISSAESLSALVVDTAEETGGIGELLFAWRPRGASDSLALDLEAADWDDAMAFGPRAFFLACKFAVPYLVSRPGSRIVLMIASSDANAADGAARAALLRTAESMGRELAEFGVSVETIG